MTDRELELSHCPHGVYLHEDICLTCLQPTGSGFACTHCGIGGNGLWADDHLRKCAGLSPSVGANDAIPF